MLDLDIIQQELNNLSNKVSEPRLIPNGKISLNIPIPTLRKIAKQIAKKDYKYFIENMSDDFLEYELLKVMVLGYAEDNISEIIKYFKKLTPIVHDWCVCDTLCQGFKISKKYQKEVWQEVLLLSKQDKEYSQRIVSVIMLSHFLNDEYIDKTLKVIETLKNNSYYSKMGIAWFIATAYGKYPEKVYSFLSKNNLDIWTHNKAIQKSIESLRITKENKEKIKKLKRSGV